MKTYFAHEPGVSAASPDDLVRVTPAYVEFAFPREGSAGYSEYVSYVYAAPESESGLVVLTFWDDLFDQHFKLMDDAELGEDWTRILNKTYPTLGQLINNGLHDRFGEAAVVRSVDPDTSSEGWFIVARVGNLVWDHASLESMFENEKVTATVRRLEDRCDAVLIELANNKIGLADRTRIIAKGQLHNLDRLAALINRLPDPPKLG